MSCSSTSCSRPSGHQSRAAAAPPRAASAEGGVGPAAAQADAHAVSDTVAHVYAHIDAHADAHAFGVAVRLTVRLTVCGAEAAAIARSSLHQIFGEEAA